MSSFHYCHRHHRIIIIISTEAPVAPTAIVRWQQVSSQWLWVCLTFCPACHMALCHFVVCRNSHEQLSIMSWKLNETLYYCGYHLLFGRNATGVWSWMMDDGASVVNNNWCHLVVSLRSNWFYYKCCSGLSEIMKGCHQNR